MKTITTDELKNQCDQKGKLTLVNTLGAESFEKTRIPGAVNIPLDNSDFALRVERQAQACRRVLCQRAMQLVGKSGEETRRCGLHCRFTLHRRCRSVAEGSWRGACGYVRMKSSTLVSPRCQS